MKAIDTNLVVRLLLADDPLQTAIATAVIDAGNVVVPPTVVLETLWVMRSNYGASDADILRSLQQLSRHPSITIGTDSEQAAEFLRLWAAGLDPEDAAHVAFVGETDAFVTFDKDFSKRAKKAGSTVPVELAR